MRDRFIEGLARAAAQDPRIALVVGDLGFSVVETFARQFPDRFWNVGVAEQDMTGFAAGLSMAGRIVFTYSIANFSTVRCLEQIRNDVCYHRANVKIVAVGCGYAYGSHGYTHHALEDLGIMRTLPGMAVYAPADPAECEKMLQRMVAIPGPAYLRLGKNREPDLHGGSEIAPHDGMHRLREGSDATVFAVGPILGEAQAACDALAAQSLSVGLVCVPVLKPLDREVMASYIRAAPWVATLEEHCAFGGLGSAVAEVMAENGSPARLKRFAASDDMYSIGSQDYLRRRSGLDRDSIAQTLGELLA